MNKDFIIHRYCSGNWPQIKGLAPFISSGPKFNNWVVYGSLEKNREYRFIKELFATLSSITGSDDDIRDSISELLLREQIVQALWCVNARQSILPSKRWDESIRHVASEIGGVSPARWAIEMLSGINDESFYRSYVADDGLILQSSVIPDDGY